MNYLEMIDEWHDLTNSEQTINNFCKEKKISLTREEKIRILSEISKKDVFGYSTFLSNSIPLIAENDAIFLELLEIIIQATKGDLATGWFEMALVKIGKENPTLGIKLSKKMQQIEPIQDFSSAPLGGVGYENYSKIEKIVDSMLTSENPKEVTLGIRVIRIAFSRKEIDNKQEIFSKIQTILKHDNKDVSLEATLFFLEFYEQEPKLSQEHLLELAKMDDSHKGIITRHLWIHPIKDENNAIELIKECYNSKNQNIQHLTYYALTKYTKIKHKEIMSIIRQSFENEALSYGSLEELIRELGKNALHETLNDFEEWLGTDNFHLKLSIPRFVRILIPNGEKQSCFEYFKKWSESKSVSTDLFLKIYKQVLAGCYGNEFDQDFVKNSKELLSKKVSDSGINPKLFLRDEQDETLQCASLIKGLEYYSKNLDYERISDNIELFSNLKNILTEKWILKKKQENNRTNLLLRVLERRLPEDEKINEIMNAIEKSKDDKEFNWNRYRLGNHVHDFFYLLNIEQNIMSLQKRGINTVKHFRDKLHNDEQAGDAVSELNLLGNLAEHYNLTLEVPVGTKNIDALIEIDGQKFYLEITNPSGFSPVELFEGEVFTVPHRAKNKILDKCERQLSQIPESNIPAILGIDIRGSDVDEMSITDALHGSTQYTFLMDKETGEDRGGYSSLKDNSIHKSKPESDILSAVLCFKSELLNDYRFHITGGLIHNPNAKNPLIHHITKRIEEILIQKEKKE